MKKTIMGLVVLLGMGTSQVNAQNITGGVKAEGNLSNFILSDMDANSSNMGFGATLGGFAKFDVTRGFAIQPELLVHFQNSEWEEAGKKRDFEYWGLEIPIYAMGQWYTPNRSRFYAGVGPYVGVGLDAKFKDPELKAYKDDVLQAFDFGAAAQLGYEFRNGIQINAAYKVGFVDALDTGKDDATMLPQRLSLGVGYRF